MKEFVQKDSVQFAGIKEEDEFEKTKAISTANNTLEKIKRLSRASTSIVIHVKKFEVEGYKKKYSVRARVNWPGNFFEAKHEDWNFLTTTQAALMTLTSEVKKWHQKETKKKI